MVPFPQNHIKKRSQSLEILRPSKNSIRANSHGKLNSNMLLCFATDYQSNRARVNLPYSSNDLQSRMMALSGPYPNHQSIIGQELFRTNDRGSYKKDMLGCRQYYGQDDNSGAKKNFLQFKQFSLFPDKPSNIGPLKESTFDKKRKLDEAVSSTSSDCSDPEDGKSSPVSRPDSPDSDNSSGLGTLSPSESDAEVIAAPSPQPSPTPPPQVPEPSKTTEIRYQGRNLLDLYDNMTYQWQFQMAVVPPPSLANHFQQRSIYHRLGPFGTLEELGSDSCRDCGFQTVVPKY